MSKPSKEVAARVEAGVRAIHDYQRELDREQLDRQMGLARAQAPEARLEGTRLVIPAMTPEQARERLAQINARKAAVR